MNTATKKFCLVIASAALLLAGCQKKPKRPDPSATLIGQNPGGTVNPTEVTPATDLTAAGLTQREEFDMNGQLRNKFEPVLFDFDKSNIKESERVKLQDAAKYLKDHADQRLLLEGHCDWRGTAEYNLGLGDRRASAAKKYLNSIGVGADKAETLSKVAWRLRKTPTMPLWPKTAA